MYRSGNVELGASVKGWMDQFSALLTAAGWTITEDLFTEEAPEGSRLFTPASDEHNGYLEVFVNNAVTRLRMVKTPKRRFATRSVERAHDLANGFNYFADLSGEHVAVILETPAGVSTPMVAGVKTPDALSPAWAGQGVTPPRGFTCEPVEDQVSVTHHLLASPATRYSYGQYSRGAWVTYSGHDHHSAWYSLRSQPTKDERLTSLSPNVMEVGEGIYPPSLIIGEGDGFYSRSFARIVAYAGWSFLPGVYLTNAAAGDRVAVLADDADLIYGGGGRAVTSAVAVDADEILLDTTDLPESGILHLGEEYLSYSAKEATRVTGLTRGLYGTEASDHAAPTTQFSDDFSGDLSAYEIEDAGATVQSSDGALRLTNSNFSTRRPRLSVSIGAKDGAISVNADLTSFTSNEEVWLFGRRTSNNEVYAHFTPTRLQLGVLEGATTRIITLDDDDFPTPVAGTHTLRLELEEDEARVFVDGVLFMSAETFPTFRGAWGVGAQLYNPSTPVVLDDLSFTSDDQVPLRAYLGSWWVKSGSAVIAAGGEKP